MTFKWKIIRPPFHAAIDGAQVMHPSIEVEFETGSIDEALGIFNDNTTELGKMFGPELMNSASNLAKEIGTGEAAPVETDKERKARLRAEKRNAADPSTANAPAPLAIPGAEPEAPAVDPLAIPANLQRTAAAPPPPPPAPPAPPAAPPTGILAGKITAELDKRAAGAADGGQALADWLATSGITVKGATYAEAVTVLRLQADEKLGPIATALGVA